VTFIGEEIGEIFLSEEFEMPYLASMIFVSRMVKSEPLMKFTSHECSRACDPGSATAHTVYLEENTVINRVVIRESTTI